MVSHGASVGRDVTLVAIRAAVQMVTAADGFRERTATIFSTGQHAASVSICALVPVRTNDLTNFFRFHFGKERDCAVFSAASAGRDVACTVFGAAVQMVAAADGVSERTAPVTPTGQHAASVSICALAPVRTNDLTNFFRFHFGKERDCAVFSAASAGRDVACTVFGAAVQMVAAADGVRERTAPVTPTGQHAASVSICALAPVRTNDLTNFFRFHFGKERDCAVFSAASAGRDVACTVFGAAVQMVAAADGVRERTAPVTPTGQRAASVSTCALAPVRTKDAR